jgi:G:T-mismatch repair DNA endonuclease (very short patch repair protein)
MILEDATYEAYGYYPKELTPKSSRKNIIAICSLCGEIKITTKHDYHPFCMSCAMTEKSHHDFDKRGSAVNRVCKHCGKSFKAARCQVKHGWGVFCCRNCQLTHQRHTRTRELTAPERVFKGICIKNALPFRFVGDGALWLGNANPDFVHNTKKIVVEVFGDYWHSPLLNRHVRYIQTREGREAQLEKEGYKCIILWESDLKREDAEKYILNVLKEFIDV